GELPDELVPPERPSDREADVAGHSGALLEPVEHLALVGAAAQDDADDVVAATRPGLRDGVDAVLTALETLDLPDVRLDARVLELVHRLYDECRPKLGVEALLRAADRLELMCLRGHEQLEQELTLALVQPVRQHVEARGLPPVQLAVALRVVADEHLREGGIEILDVAVEV